MILFAGLALLLATAGGSVPQNDECAGDAAVEREQRASNRDGSTLTLSSAACRLTVVYEKKGLRKTLLKIHGDGGASSLFDLNDDGMMEVGIADGCGAVDCDNIIYKIDYRKLSLRPVLKYFGQPPPLPVEDEYWISNENVAGYGVYRYKAYRVRDKAAITVDQQPAFQIDLRYDEDSKESACLISGEAPRDRSAVMDELIEKYCFPGSTVTYSSERPPRREK
jgi:hypothetical protein